MMKRILFLLTGLILLVACQENVEPKDPEFDNWKARNEAAFKTQLNVARQNIASAKAQYGNAWEANCDYRLMRKFSLTGESQVKYRDTLCVQILARGTGSGSPYFTDTVRINYTVRLMPTTQHPEGKLMAHSGQSAVATALMKMRIGDHWRLYIPADLAYFPSNYGKLPAGSMLIMEIQLKGYYRIGTKPGDWK